MSGRRLPRCAAGRGPSARRRVAALLVASAGVVIAGVAMFGASHAFVDTTAQVAPSAAPSPTDLRCLTRGSNGECNFPAPAVGTPPVAVQSPVPCPSPANGPVCTRYTNPRSSSTTPPALPSQHNPAAACTAQPPPGSPNGWVRYGSPQLIDWHTVTADAPQAPGEAVPDPSYDNEFPLPFKVVVDRLHPCVAYRIGGASWSQIQRSLDGGTTWSVVLDGSQVAPSPRFRRITVAGQDAMHETVYALEESNGDALVASNDEGTTWRLASGSPSDAANLIGEYPYALAAGQDPNVVYVATLQCFGQRQHPQWCQNEQHLDTGQDTGKSRGGYVGSLRLYWSRDGGHTWNALADGGNGLPDCTIQWLDMTPDPDDDGHLWIDYYAAPDPIYHPCSQAEPAGGVFGIEGRWNQTDYAISSSSATCPYAGTFSVTRAPSGKRRIVCNYLRGYSDDDGATWTPFTSPFESGPSSGFTSNFAVAPNRDLVKLAMVAYGAYDPGGTAEPRLLVYHATRSGGYDIGLGATLPGYGGVERSLFDWPPYDPVIPPLHYDLLANEDSGEHVADYEIDGAGNVYMNVGIVCYNPACTPDAAARAGMHEDNTKAHWAVWQTMRYTMPSPGTLPVLLSPYSAQDQSTGTTPHTTTSCTSTVQNSCYLVPIHQCSLTGDSSDDANGTVAFTGNDLLYTRTGERGPAPFTAMIHRLDPAACAAHAQVPDAGAVIVHFPPDQYARARAETQLDDAFSGPWLNQPALPVDRPVIDTITYDANHDRIYFTLEPENVPDPNHNRSNGVAAMENQLALWSADLHSSNGVPASNLDATLVSVDTGYCPDDNGLSHVGAASQVLAYDPIGDNTAAHGHPDGVIWACLPGRPAALDTAGSQVDEPCYASFEMSGVADTGLHVDSWSMEDLSPRSGQHRALLDLNGPGGAGLEVFDLQTCTEGRHYQPNHQQPAAYGSSTLACDAVTYGSDVRVGDPNETAQLESQEGVPPFTGSLRGAVIWQRTGATLIAGLIPDNGDAPSNDAETCRMPVTLAYTGPAVVQPGLLHITGRLSIDGTGAPAVQQPILVSVDGHPVDGSPVPTRPDGTFTLTTTVGDGQHTIRLQYAPSATNLAFYSADTVAVVGPAAVVPGSGPRPGGTSEPSGPQGGNVVLGLGNLPPPVVVDRGSAPLAAQAQGSQAAQGQAQAAAAEQREEEHQLAYAYEFPDDAEPGTESAPSGAPPSDTMPMTSLSARSGREVLTGASLSGLASATLVGLVVLLRWSSAQSRRRERAIRTRGARR